MFTEELRKSREALHELRTKQAQTIYVAELSGWSSFLSFGILAVFIAFVLFMAAEVAADQGPIKLVASTAAFFIVASAVPVTYAVGGRLRYKQDWSFFQPGGGGLRFVIFQGLSWAFFGLTLILPTLPMLLSFYYPECATYSLYSLHVMAYRMFRT